MLKTAVKVINAIKCILTVDAAVKLNLLNDLLCINDKPLALFTRKVFDISKYLFVDSEIATFSSYSNRVINLRLDNILKS